MNEELEKFRVWPDGTVQQVFEPESIYSWMSDDYQVVDAAGVDQWRKSDETNTADLEEAKTISQVAMATLRNANARQKETERGSLEWAKYKLESEKAMIEIARANVLAYPFTAGPEYQKRVDNYEAFVKAASELESKIQAAASTYYSKAFCVKCLTDRNRTGGVWRNRMFFCGDCK